jgi:hypothetical protein
MIKIRIILLLLITLFSKHIFASSQYIYPALYDKKSPSCVRLENIEKKLLLSFNGDSTENSPAAYIDKAFDIDNDGICDVFLYPPSDMVGSGGPWHFIYNIKENGFKELGATTMGSVVQWLGAEKNGYARLYVPAYIGHRTNPTYTTNVYYFNGSKYEIEYKSKSSYGYLVNQGLKAYKKKDYSNAEKWYLNAYRMKGEKQIQDANNLALVYIKTTRYKQAIALVTKHLNIKPCYAVKTECSPSTKAVIRFRASAYHNRGLAYNKLGMKAQAEWDFGQSKKLKR